MGRQTPERPDWHGLSVSGTKLGAMHVGPYPGRKAIALYHVSAHESRVLAYFRDEDSARVALDWLDGVTAFVGWAGSQVETSAGYRAASLDPEGGPAEAGGRDA